MTKTKIGNSKGSMRSRRVRAIDFQRMPDVGHRKAFIKGETVKLLNLLGGRSYDDDGDLKTILLWSVVAGSGDMVTSGLVSDDVFPARPNIVDWVMGIDANEFPANSRAAKRKETRMRESETEGLANG